MATGPIGPPPPLPATNPKSSATSARPSGEGLKPLLSRLVHEGTLSAADAEALGQSANPARDVLAARDAEKAKGWGRVDAQRLKALDALVVATGGKPSTAVGEPPSGTPEGTHTVVDGESLSRIAQQVLGDANRWPEIYELNKALIGPNPNRIYPGQVLRYPAPPATQAPAQAAPEPTEAPANPVGTGSTDLQPGATLAQGTDSAAARADAANASAKQPTEPADPAALASQTAPTDEVSQYKATLSTLQLPELEALAKGVDEATDGTEADKAFIRPMIQEAIDARKAGVPAVTAPDGAQGLDAAATGDGKTGAPDATLPAGDAKALAEAAAADPKAADDVAKARAALAVMDVTALEELKTKMEAEAGPEEKALLGPIVDEALKKRRFKEGFDGVTNWSLTATTVPRALNSMVRSHKLDKAFKLDKAAQTGASAVKGGWKRPSWTGIKGWWNDYRVRTLAKDAIVNTSRAEAAVGKLAKFEDLTVKALTALGKRADNPTVEKTVEAMANAMVAHAGTTLSRAAVIGRRAVPVIGVVTGGKQAWDLIEGDEETKAMGTMEKATAWVSASTGIIGGVAATAVVIAAGAATAPLWLPAAAVVATVAGTTSIVSSFVQGVMADERQRAVARQFAPPPAGAKG